MVRFVAGRLSQLIILLFLASLATFFLIQLLPGSPCLVRAGDAPTPQNIAACKALLGLNSPLWQQYFVWVWHILHGNFGISYANNTSVRTGIASALPIDGEIALMSQILALSAAVPAAIYAARHPNRVIDRILNGAAFFLLATPTFIVIIVLQNVLAVNWHWPDVSPGVFTPGGDWVTNLLVLILPAFVVSIPGFVVYFRILRSDMITTFLEDYITLARSKGLSGRRIVMRHAFRASSLSLVGVFALVFGGVIGGTFVVEFLCDIPGIGRQLIYAAYGTDYITIQGDVLVISTIVLTLLILADILNHFIDPRVALE